MILNTASVLYTNIKPLDDSRYQHYLPKQTGPSQFTGTFWKWLYPLNYGTQYGPKVFACGTTFVICNVQPLNIKGPYHLKANALFIIPAMSKFDSSLYC